MPRKLKELKRISVALDDNTYRLLHELAEEKSTTVSDVVRMAILTYSNLNGRSIEIDKLEKYHELLYGGENVIVDIEIWVCILDELSERGSEKLWRCIERIGTEFGIQFKNMGLKDAKETLNQLEVTNWFRLKSNKNNYTLVLRSRNEVKLLKIFLENMFKAQDISVEILEGFKKLMIKQMEK